VRHPGRFEIVEPPATPPGVPRIILDGAHNPHGAAALADALRARGERPVLIAAVSTDKDVAAIARALAPAVRAVVATRYQQERAMDPARLAGAFADTMRSSRERAPAFKPVATHAERGVVTSASDPVATQTELGAIASISGPVATHAERGAVGSISDPAATHAQPAAVARSDATPPASDAIATAPDLAAAIAIAATYGAPIVIAGSLFLVGEARSLLLGAPTDPVWISDPSAAPLAR